MHPSIKRSPAILLSGYIITQAAVVVAQSAAPVPSTAYIQRLQGMQFTQADFQAQVCQVYAAQSYYGKTSLSYQNLCALLSNQPGFWSTTQVQYYALQSCDGSTTSYFMNLLGATGSPSFNISGFPIATRLTTQDPTWAVGNPPAAPVSTTQICPTLNVPNFLNPTWFTASGTSVNSVSVFVVGSILTPQTPASSGGIAGNSLQYTFLRTGNITQPLTLNFTTGGTAVAGIDYTFSAPGLPAGSLTANSLTIPAGTSSAAVYATAAPAYQQPEKTLTLTLAGFGNPNGNSAGYISGGTIMALWIPAVTVNVSTTNLQVGNNPNVLTFTRSVSGGGTLDTSQPLALSYTISGTAANGTDYQYLDGNTTIPAGQASVTVPITVNQPSGGISQPAKTIVIGVASSSTNNYQATPGTVTLTTPAYTAQTVSFTASGSTTIAPGMTGNFIVSRSTTDNSQPLTITYTVGGSAQSGSDYAPLSGNATIPPGQNSVVVPIYVPVRSGTTAIPQQDITITPAAGGYAIANGQPPLTFTIPAYTPSSVSLSAPGGGSTATIIPGQSSTVTVTRMGGDTSVPLVVNYSVAGTALNGTDYTGPNGTAVIPAGQTSTTIPVNTTTPSGATPAKTIVLTPTSGNGYAPGSGTTYTIAAYTPTTTPAVSISGGPANGTPTPVPVSTPVISISFDPSGPAFVVQRSGGDLTKPLTIPVQFTGTAIPGVDYAALPGAASFAANQDTVRIPVSLLPGATPGRTIFAAILELGINPAPYTIAGSGAADYTIPGTIQPATTTTSSSSDSGGGSALPVIGGIAAAGGLAAATGVFGGGAVVAGLPNNCPVSSAQLDTIRSEFSTIVGIPAKQLASHSFSSLPAFERSGSGTFRGQRLQWQPGQSPAQVFKLAQLDGFTNPHCFSLAQIARLSGFDYSQFTLSQLGIKDFAALARVYEKATVDAVPGLAEYLRPMLIQAGAGSASLEQIKTLTIADLPTQYPALAKMPVSGPVTSIPGLMDHLQIQELPNWKGLSVAQIPGLTQIPIGKFPTAIVLPAASSNPVQRNLIPATAGGAPANQPGAGGLSTGSR